jgi:hypothetical protein
LPDPSEDDLKTLLAGDFRNGHGLAQNSIGTSA